MAEERNFAPGKFWIMRAFERGVDPTDASAMERFVEDARADRVPFDQDVLDEVMKRHLMGEGRPEERAFPQLPVALPSERELAAAAEESKIIRQLRAFVDWVGPDGRALTAKGNFKLDDARELVDLLDTGDEMDPVIADEVWKTQSARRTGRGTPAQSARRPAADRA
jgi:hypothetical protein